MSQAIGVWTLAELDRLPDDGNKYELVDGELFVTRAPSVDRPQNARFVSSRRMVKTGSSGGR
jgi:hypothetical protein